MFEEGSYLVKAEPSLLEGRELAFPNLSAAQYFARTWAHKSQVAILVVDCRSGEPLERYSRRPAEAWRTRRSPTSLPHELVTD